MLWETHYTSHNPNIRFVGSREAKGRSVDLTLQYKHPAGATFKFHVTGNFVDVTTQNGGDPWYKVLSEQEKTDIFQSILAEYRTHTEGDGQWRGAAIGITEGNPPKIYIGKNTKRQSAFYKDCAESNMVNSIEAQIASRGGISMATHDKLQAVYVMGGREPGTLADTDKGSPINCPCGKCTDILSNNMVEGGKIYAMPVPNGNKLEKIETVHSDQQAFTEAEKANYTNPNTPLMWETTIEHLNAHRDIPLSALEADIVRNGAKSLVSSISELPQKRAGAELGFSLEDFRAQRGDAVKQFIDKLLKPVGDLPMEVAKTLKAAENVLFHRNSIPELDLVSEKSPEDALGAVNHYMVEQIRDTLANRVAGKGLDPQKVADGNDKICSVRCVVIKLSDGTFHSGVELDSAYDKATPSAEMNAVAHAIPNLVNAGVEQVWAMEFNPEDLKKGKAVMHTSSKEGIERIVKRAQPGADLSLTYLPFNDGSQAALDTLKQTVSHTQFKLGDIFPSSFAGNNLATGAPAR